MLARSDAKAVISDGRLKGIHVATYRDRPEGRNARPARARRLADDAHSLLARRTLGLRRLLLLQ